MRISTATCFPRRALATRILRASVLVVMVAGCASTPSPAPALATPSNAAASPVSVSSPTAVQTPAASVPAAAEASAPPAASEDPTSADVILDALAAGSIDETTALLYRVYAIFGDQRLPAEYQSPAWEEDGSALAEAALQMESLPLEVAAELRPFLARPTDPISVFHGSATSASLPSSAALALARPQLPWRTMQDALTCDAASDWGYIDGAKPFRVWGRCTGPVDAPRIQEVVDMVEDLWPPMTALMGPPIPDRDTSPGAPAEAADGRLDIYLADRCVSRGNRCLWDSGSARAAAGWSPEYRGTAGSKASSGFIVVNDAILGGGTDTMSTLAHELFHVLEYAHNFEGVVEIRWHWAVEAFATWASWYFVPESRGSRVYPRFATYQGSGLGLQRTNGSNEYASYLWPFFMEQERGAAAVQAAWVAIEGLADFPSITAAIDRQLPFATDYRKLAVRAWNETLRPGNPYDKRLQDLDPTLPELLPTGRRISATGLLPANAPGTPPRRIPESIESLYSRYAHFPVHDDVGQVTFDFGKLDPLDALDVDALLKIKGKGWEHRAWPNGKVRLCTNNPDDDAEEIIVVLSNHDIDPRLFIAGEWTVESLKEPCSGWEVDITWTDRYAGIEDTITLHGTIETLDAEAPGDGAFLVGEGTASGRRLGWKECNPGIEVVPAGSVRAEFGAQVIGDTVTISGWAGFDTALSGVVTGAFTVPVEGGEATIEPGPLVGDLCSRNSFGTIEVTWYEKR